MVQMKWITVCVLCVALTALAEPPNNGGSRGGPGGGKPGERNEQRGDRGGGGGDRGGGNFGGRPNFDSKRREEEAKKRRDEFVTFASQHAPARYAEFQRQMDAKKQGAFGVLFRVGAEYNWLPDPSKDKKLYDIKINQIKIEDKEFSLLLAKKYPTDAQRNPSKLTSEDADKQLQEQAKLYVDSKLEERAYRLAQLEKRIADEKQRLAADQKNPEKLVVEHIQQMEKEGLEPRGGPGPNRRPDGEGAERPGERQTVPTDAPR
jgi:hypothetical protein